MKCRPGDAVYASIYDNVSAASMRSASMHRNGTWSDTKLDLPGRLDAYRLHQ
jgi:hypothetical protein